jgi:hypothetical protein
LPIPDVGSLTGLPPCDTPLPIPSVFPTPTPVPTPIPTPTPTPQLCLTPPNDLVSWWTGDNTANDAVGTNHGTLKNSASYQVGKVSDAFRFNGTTAYVEVPDNNSLDVPNAFTVNAWVQVDVLNVSQIIVSKGACKPNGYVFRLLTTTGGLKLSAQIGAPGATCGTINNGEETTTHAVITDTHFHHVALTYAGGTTKDIQFYIDGVEAQTQVVNPAPISVNNTALPFLLGAALVDNAGGPSFPSGFLDGLLDEVQLFSRALSASEISDIFTVGSEGQCK